MITRDILVEALRAGPFEMPVPWSMKDAIDAAVVVPISLDPEPILHLVLRGHALKDHAGEVGFPGGKPERGDDDLRATAAREAAEEVDLAPDSLDWVGRLSPCPVITGRFLIHPFVAVLAPGALPRVASPEIAAVLELPIAPLLDGSVRVRGVTGEWMGVAMTAPHFEVRSAENQGKHVLYGASAYITYELLSRVAAALGTSLLPLVMEPIPPWARRYAPAEG